MLLDGSSLLPTLEPLTLYSFYPHPISPRSHVHSTLFPSTENQAAEAGPSTSTKWKKQKKTVEKVNNDNGIRREDVKESMKRAERRALMGKRPAGIGLGKDDDEVINDEDMLDHEQHDINMFGHRFLLPFGRRLTQMEMDAAPSPSPSDHDHERRQEDHAMGGSPMMEPQMQEGEMEDEDEQVDLDASIEDLDNSETIDDGSIEEEE
ncbi:uncharacterized protein L201_006017 [Kwoniella dendrophila CBS 6074]|uniref:Anaphase-promoting complex subunit 13 n=1 Tax=Kwoniella dendrophila CBS 6074 TaxID=1295534 RepID=A0AAX4K009_9TREE